MQNAHETVALCGTPMCASIGPSGARIEDEPVELLTLASRAEYQGGTSLKNWYDPLFGTVAVLPHEPGTVIQAGDRRFVEDWRVQPGNPGGHCKLTVLLETVMSI